MIETSKSFEEHLIHLTDCNEKGFQKNFAKSSQPERLRALLLISYQCLNLGMFEIYLVEQLIILVARHWMIMAR